MVVLLSVALSRRLVLPGLADHRRLVEAVDLEPPQRQPAVLDRGLQRIPPREPGAGCAGEDLHERGLPQPDVGRFVIRYAGGRSATHAGDDPRKGPVSEPRAQRVKDQLGYTLAS